jgi:hypothetical protein
MTMTSATKPIPSPHDVYMLLLGRKASAATLEAVGPGLARQLRDGLNKGLEHNGYGFTFDTVDAVTARNEPKDDQTVSFTFAGTGNDCPGRMQCTTADAAMLVDHMLGCSSDDDEADGKSLTIIQNAVLTVFARIVMATLASVASPGCELRLAPVTEGLDLDGPWHDIVLAGSFGGGKTRIRIGVTHRIVIGLHKRQTSVSAPKAGAVSNGRPGAHSPAVTMPVNAVLNLPPIAVAQLAKLRPGDMLALSEGGGMQAFLTSADRKLCECHLGQNDGRYAIKVSGKVSGKVAGKIIGDFDAVAANHSPMAAQPPRHDTSKRMDQTQ